MTQITNELLQEAMHEYLHGDGLPPVARKHSIGYSRLYRALIENAMAMPVSRTWKGYWQR